MKSTQDQIVRLRELVQQKRYDEARDILESLDHPKAEEWLRQIEARQAAEKSAPPTRSASKPSSPSPDPYWNKLNKTPPSKPAAGAIDGTITVLRVLIGSIIALVVVVAGMVWIDQQFSIHPYFIDDSNRRIFLFTTGFAFLSTGVFGFIARLIGGAANFFIGLYYVVLTPLLLGAWHYLSVYLLQNGDGALGSPLSAQAIAAYRAFLDRAPLQTMLAYGVAVVVSLGAAYFLGATSDEELLKRARSR
jgi:hypothetical protein